MYQERLTDVYEYLYEDLQFILKSSIRFRIMVSLLRSPKTFDEIKGEVKVSLPALYSNIRLLLEEGSISRLGDCYSLTSEATLKTLSALKLMNSVRVINGFDEMWLNHDISGIPEYLIEDIDWLINSELIRSAPEDIYRPHNTYRELIADSEEVYGVSPISHRDLVDIYEGLLGRGVPVELVLTDGVIREMVLNASFGLLRTAIKNRNLKILRFPGPLKVAFTVTDRFLSLGLFDSRGFYDQNRDIMSTDRRAIEWGFRLYDHYRERSEKLGIRNLTGIMLSP
ncbi:winged helix-turn-helix domain-containing protein [Methanothermobacter sp. K4]|uniref:helix-turn-helix transcriptional regulator n=1 Tax=Methanothermobacter sp. K4 TaxID=2913262 RepID=UPI001EDB2D48|nr:winged helix-turn-helix domain-containing protein [Methanothermobacter sp. K4]MCG2829335.1 winged helix-turn-helix domain-containing protein [Methanothermobacter sp. K4]